MTRGRLHGCADMDHSHSADMISHWEDGDVCIHELFYSVRVTRLHFVGEEITRAFAGLDYLHVHRTRRPKLVMTIESDVCSCIAEENHCKYINIIIKCELSPPDNDDGRHPMFVLLSSPLLCTSPHSRLL